MDETNVPKLETLPEEIEDEVMNSLPQLDAAELEVIYGILGIDVQNGTNGKKGALYRYLIKHLCDDAGEDDGCYKKVLLVYKHLNKKNPDPNDQTKKNELKESPHKNIEPQQIKTDLVRWNNWKISGTIGIDTENKMTYASLKYQVEYAKKMNYPETLICSAIIKAICPSNHVRAYLENSPDIDLVNMLDILHSHCTEQDSASYFTEMQNASQDPLDTPIQFITKLLVLRQKVLNLSVEEGCAYDKKLIAKRFFHTLFTGLRSDSVRSELREKCKDDYQISDNKLLKYAADVMANDLERKLKLNTNKNGSSVNSLDIEKKDSTSTESNKKKEKMNPFLKIEELKVSHQKEMSLMRAELSEIKNAIKASNANPTFIENKQGEISQGNQFEMMRNNGQFDTRNNAHLGFGNNNKFNSGYGGRFSGRRNFRKCPQCVIDNATRCFHCFKCGASEHRMANCPNNQKN